MKARTSKYALPIASEIDAGSGADVVGKVSDLLRLDVEMLDVDIGEIGSRQ